MRTTAILLLGAALLASPVFGASKFGPTDGIRDLGYACAGCTNQLLYTNSIVEMRSQGINPNVAMFSASETDQNILTSTGQCRATDYLALARLSSYLATSPDVPRPFLLDLSGVIFGTSPERNCMTTSDSWYVRMNYQTRLNTFKQVSGTNFNTNNVWAILIFGEVANQLGAVTDSTTINAIANYVKQLWPGIPVMAGYPTAATFMDDGMSFFPARFPTSLDYIGTWDYSVTDPFGTDYTSAYTNTAGTGIADRLRWYQKLVYVVGTFSRQQPASCPARFSLNGERFDLLVRRWCAWAMDVHADKSIGLLDFYWGGPSSGGAYDNINFELNTCGGAALKPAMISAVNTAVSGPSCWGP